MAFNRTYSIYLRKSAGAGQSLITSLNDATAPSAPRWIAGDDFTLQVFFCGEPPVNGAPFTGDQINGGDAIFLAAKATNNLAAADLLFSATPFTEVNAGGVYSYRATLNLNTTQLLAALSAAGGQLNVSLDIQVQNAGNTARETFRVPVIVLPRLYIGTEGDPTTGDPTYPAAGSLMVKGFFLSQVLGNGVDTVTVDYSGLTLPEAPSKVIALSVAKNAAGDSNLYASYVEGTATATEANFELNAPTDNASRVLHFLVIP